MKKTIFKATAAFLAGLSIISSGVSTTAFASFDPCHNGYIDSDWFVLAQTKQNGKWVNHTTTQKREKFGTSSVYVYNEYTGADCDAYIDLVGIDDNKHTYECNSCDGYYGNYQTKGLLLEESRTRRIYQFIKEKSPTTRCYAQITFKSAKPASAKGKWSPDCKNEYYYQPLNP